MSLACHLNKGFPEPALISNEVTEVMFMYALCYLGEALRLSATLPGVCGGPIWLSSFRGAALGLRRHPRRPLEVLRSVIHAFPGAAGAGTLRLFAIPGFEGDVRVVTVVDETAATEVLAQIGHAGMLGNAGALELSCVGLLESCR